MSCNPDHESLHGKGDAPITYWYRWVILVLYCLVNMSYGVMWVTFAPISDVVSNYFHGGVFGSATAINLLGTVFLIFYIPGTILSSISLKRFKLRNTIIIGSSVVVLAAFVRYIATLCYSSTSISTVYSLMLLGQILAALGQPLLLNLPPVISADWFPVSERDIATTIGAMCNSVGNAIGNVIPVELVTQSKKNDEYTVHGMDNLMLTEFMLCIVPLVLAVVYFKDAPPTPPSLSTAHKLDSVSQAETDESKSTYALLYSECVQLSKNRDYLILFTSFSGAMGFFCAFLTLLNQIILPFGYSNEDAGVFGVVYLIAGLAGAAVSSLVMQRTRAYRVILKTVTFLSMLSSLLFVLMLFENNYWPLLFSIVLLGFFVMPIMPVSMENCVECTYPLPEELSVGLLMVGESVLGLPLIFALQETIQVQSARTQLNPTNIFIFGMLFFCFVVTLFYNGEYRRSQKEGEDFTPLGGEVPLQQFNVIGQQEYNVVIKDEI